MEELVKYLKALIVLQVALYEAGQSPGRAELLLARAGLTHTEIAEILGKSYMAVAKTMSRAGRAKRRR